MSRDHSQNHYGPNASFDGHDSDLASAGILIESLRQQLATCERQRDKIKFALENCRLFAARNRKESWALLILGFLAECGVVGSPLRDSSDHCEPDWTEYDGEYLK